MNARDVSSCSEGKIRDVTHSCDFFQTLLIRFSNTIKHCPGAVTVHDKALKDDCCKQGRAKVW